MGKKDNNIGNTKSNRFKMVIFDEVSLKERFNFSLSKINLFTYLGIAFILLSFLVGLLLIYTPLKYLLPPVENYALEKKIVQNYILIDSLEKQIIQRDYYFDQIKNIITKDNLLLYGNTDSIDESDILTQSQKDSILNELIERDKNSLSIIRDEQGLSGENLYFVKPLSGAISNGFNPKKSHNGIDIVAPEGTPVLSTLQGTVILATWSVNSGYIIQIQHPNNFISVYKHNAEILKKEGDKVIAGEPIALTGNTGQETDKPHLHFEIWQNGVPVDPTEFINF